MTADSDNRSMFSGGHSSLTVAALLAMVVAIVVGYWGHEWQSPLIQGLVHLLRPLAVLWTNALQMVIVPLACSYLFLALATPRNVVRTGRAVGFALCLFWLFLILGTLITVLLSPRLFDFFAADLKGVGLGDAGLSIPMLPEEVPASPSLENWFSQLIPANLFRALGEGQMLPVLIATLMVGFATTRLPEQGRNLLIQFAQAVADVTMILVRWILWFLPLAVFAFTLSVAAHSGAALFGPLAWYIAILSLILFAFALAFYPIAVLIGGVPLSVFARGVFEAQVVAIGTRSSMACLQPLMESATRVIKLPLEVAELAVPLAVSVFRMSVSISSPFKLLFLGYVYGVDLAVTGVVSFLIANFLLSFGTPGIPTRVVGVRLPMYVAAGIPAEGVILLGAIDAIPDIFKTLLNVTASMSAVTLISRRIGDKD